MPIDAHHAPPPPAGRHVRWLVGLVLAPFVLVTILGLVVLWPTEDRPVLDAGQTRVRGTVVAVQRPPCPSPQARQAAQPREPCPGVRVEVTSGERSGAVVAASVPEGPRAPAFSPGDKVVLAYAASVPAGLQYEVVDFQRGLPLSLLAAAFAVAVVALGRFRGVAALVGLASTFGILLLFILPAILAGGSPLAVAVVGSSAIMLVTLYLTHGVSARTTVAVIGTLACLLLTGLLGGIAVDASRFTGLGSEEAAALASLVESVDPRSLLLAGIIIGALGVLDDVTVTQAAAVWELHAANPRLRTRGLYRAGLRVGRAHIASTVNTLVLAYAGAALPLLLLFTASRQSAGSVLTSEYIAQEVVRSLAGSLGLIAAVPLTTALAAIVVSYRPGRRARRARRARGRARRTD